MTPFRNILVPTDFGEPSVRALELAMVIGQKWDSEIALLHVYSLPVAPYTTGLSWPTADFTAAAQGALDDALAKAAYPRISGVLATGFPWEQIIDYVKTRSADLVVMGTHGRRGLSRLVLGSVAEKVIRLSPIPVLTVPAPT